MRRGILLTLTLLAALSFASAGWAASYGIDATLDYVKNLTTSGSGMMGTVLQYARSLFIGLATLSLALGLIRMLLNGESTLGTVFAHLTKWILYTGIFTWIMSHDVPQTIVNSFVAIGGKVGGEGSIAPDNILSAGIRMYGSLVEKGWNAGWGDFIGVTVLGIIILVVIAMIAGVFALALAEMYLVVCGGAVLLGFGGFEYTRNIALSYLKYVISVGMKLLMIMALYNLASDTIPAWEDSFSKATDMKTLITAAGQILGGVICIYMVVRHVPDMAQAVVNRAAMSFGAPATQMAYVSVVGAPTVNAQNGGGFMTAFMDAFRGSRHAEYEAAVTTAPVSQAPAETIEGYTTREYVRGEDGMLSGASYNPLARHHSSRPVENPANAEAMTNYVASETLHRAPTASVYGAPMRQREPARPVSSGPVAVEPPMPSIQSGQAGQ
ncbi:MAG: P-type conjugative transfer protein TrbL [Synergistaceae bacterium]|nr:P-type conjugative transfer protein TrbL [Synergistaceae bacterium]